MRKIAAHDAEKCEAVFGQHHAQDRKRMMPKSVKRFSANIMRKIANA
jgi:hypothetical protein